MNTLPDDIITEILLKLYIVDAINFSHTQRRYYRVCRNQQFWRRKFVQDYGIQPRCINDWRHIYLNYNNMYEITDTGLKILPYKAKKLSGQYFIGIDDYIYRRYSHTVKKINQQAKYISAVGDIMSVVEYPRNLLSLFINDNFKPVTNFPVKYIAVGPGPSYGFIDPDDNIYVYGDNSCNKLGLNGAAAWSAQPRLLSGSWLGVAFGRNHGIYMATDGTVYVSGSNSYGQLGLGQDIQQINTITILPNIRAKYVTCGYDNTAIIDKNNDLYIFGLFYGVKNYLRYRAFWSGCKLASVSNNNIIFTDHSDNVYYGIKIQQPIGESYRLQIKTVANFKCRDIYCDDQTIRVIGTYVR